MSKTLMSGASLAHLREPFAVAMIASHEAAKYRAGAVTEPVRFVRLAAISYL
jgi:hypothetical protein